MSSYPLLNQIGDTPIISLSIATLTPIELYAKLEFYNPTGSVKDRAADYLLSKLINSGEINSSTLVVESSSGNFGISLASFCRKYGLDFYCVIDPLISPVNEMLIRRLSTQVIKVQDRDENGGYLLNRLRVIRQMIEERSDVYWVNQYENPYNADAYYYKLAGEIATQLDELDYLFVGVSSGGTITGLSLGIKERFPQCKIVAVDVEGSVVFGGKPKARFIPGIGSSMVPPILKSARIDEVIWVDEESTIHQCHELLTNHGIFAGGSSGSVMAAIKQYFSTKSIQGNPKVLSIFCDRGDRYASTIYDSNWIQKKYPCFNKKIEEVIR